MSNGNGGKGSIIGTIMIIAGIFFNMKTFHWLLCIVGSHSWNYAYAPKGHIIARKCRFCERLEYWNRVKRKWTKLL